MSKKVIGATVGTTTSPKKMKDEIKPVTTVNGNAPDENGNVAVETPAETDPTVPEWAKQSEKPTYTADEVGALPATTKIPSKTSELENDSNFLTSFTESDPTVPDWAKESTKPTYTASEVGAVATEELTEAINTALSQAKESGEFDGADGADGKSAYEYAVDGGYEGTEEEFAAKLAFLMGYSVFGYVDENNNIILSGSIADGTYTLKYLNEDGTYEEVGSLVIGETETEESETEVVVNLIPTLTDVDLVTIYNDVGYKEDVRISTSAVSESNPTGEKTQTGTTLLGIMPLGDDGDVLHLRGTVFYDVDISGYSGLIWYYDASGTLLNTTTIPITTMGLTGTDANGDATFTLTHSKMSLIDGTAYIRFNIINPTGELIMTRNQLITD